MLGRICKLLGFSKSSFVEADKKIILDQGNTVPTDGSAGYAVGALFMHRDGGSGTALYINEGTETASDFNAVDARHAHIDYSDVRREFQTALDGLFAILGLAYYFCVGVTIQQVTQDSPNHRIVVCYDNAYSHSHYAPLSGGRFVRPISPCWRAKR